MLNSTVRPSTLDGIKRLAKSIKHQENCNHSAALNLAAQQAGFSNFKHAQNSIKSTAPKKSGLQNSCVFISMTWWDRQSKARGFELLEVPLSRPLSKLVSQTQLGIHKDLFHFQQIETDHLNSTKYAANQSEARDYICTAARVIQFIDATNLKPSKSRSRVYPNGNSMNQIPAQDHSTRWYHPETKSFILADEPYGPALQYEQEARAAWAAKHDFILVKSPWQGMYNPSGNSELYLAAPNSKADLINEIVKSLNTLPKPYLPDDWNGKSLDSINQFESPERLKRLQTLDSALTTTPSLKTTSQQKKKPSQKGKGMNPFRKLFVLALNDLLKRNALSLEWDRSSESHDGFVKTSIAERNTIVMWRDAGHGEILLTVWWNYDQSKDPRAVDEQFFQMPLAHKSRYPDFVGIVASIWLERQDGKYLQGYGSDRITNKYVRKGELEALRDLLNPEPLGFFVEGKFHF